MFFERLATGWELVKQSLKVLRLDKELLVFPLLSGIACTLVLATFAVPMWFAGVFEPPSDQDAGGLSRIVWFLIVFAFYFVNYFIMIFFNSALVGCAVIRLKGGDPVVRDGIGAAMARLPQIAGWALVAATVGMILKAIESRSEAVGRFVTGLLGAAWSILTFFVVPVIVIEQTNPIEAVRRSSSIMKSTWGEALGAHFGITFIVFLAYLVALLPAGLAAAAFSAQMIAIGVVLAVVAVVWMLLVALVSTALNSIIQAALYVYAVDHKVPAHFDSGVLEHAFMPKH
jgi:hypothetical protein